MPRSISRFCFFLFLFLFLFCFAVVAATSAIANAEEIKNSRQDKVYILEIDGIIAAATFDYLHVNFSRINEDNNAELIVIKMDTPGGLDTAMRKIIKDIVSSNIPVATLVTPSGSRAASAGTYILYASHIAAMSPATNLGAATPVTLGQTNPKSDETPILSAVDTDESDEKVQDETEPTSNEESLRKKLINDATSYIESLADLRDRNREWAKLAVTEAATLTAQEALENSVIEYIANDVDDLVQQLNGKRIRMEEGVERTLELSNVETIKLEPSLWQKIIAFITRPELASLLLILGFYGILYEIINPGSIFPGVTGVTCLLISAYAFQYIPIDYTGLGLFLLGVILIIAEFFVPGFGILAISGSIVAIIGAVFLFDSSIGIPNSPLGTVLNEIALSSLFVFFLSSVLFFYMLYITQAAKKRQRSGLINSIEGEIGICLDSFEKEGQIEVLGEVWNAISDTPLKSGERVKVISVSGLRAIVKPNQ